MFPTDSPSGSELEISIFGRGVGECIVVHLGDGKWMVVDSCLDPETDKPVALRYLEGLGIDVARDVVRVVVTHWHDDHTRGIANVLTVCSDAEFFCSGALRKEEFFTLIASADKRALHSAAGSGVDEMANVLQILRSRRKHGGARVVSPEWASASTVVYRRSTKNGVVGCLVQAVSPSSNSVTRGLIAHQPVRSAAKTAVPDPGPNELSVALHIEFGELAALLGADLEIGSSDDVGWRAVVKNSRTPSARATIVKVPHHGSQGAHYEPAWEKMVSERPYLGVTPYHSSSLPLDSDIERLRVRSAALFHASPRSRRKIKLDAASARAIGGIEIRERGGRLGQIRFRSTSDSSIVHHLFGAAAAI